MFFITKYRHNKIMKQYQEHIDDLKKALWGRDKLNEICDKLADKTINLEGSMTGYASCGIDVMDSLDDTVPRYVDDYFGGKVIRQESTPVTILDKHGIATYAVTAVDTKKGEKYILHIDPNN